MRYAQNGSLMPNYGWVQNSSNLSTVRDAVDLLEREGMNHNKLMRAIIDARLPPEERGNDDKVQRMSWDARCRIKAICACGMAELDRELQGYRLTELGKALQATPKCSNSVHRKLRPLTADEMAIFRKGLLTNPPVIRVLTLLNDSRRCGAGPLSKYDIGGQLGFAGDIGFTHFEPEYVVRTERKFNDAEGDADKWARTILSWLIQVGWAVKDGKANILGSLLDLYTTTNEVDRVLQYSARSTVKYIPAEMLCSEHHPFATVVKHRRVAILRALQKKPYLDADELLTSVQTLGADADAETLAFDILNLQQAGIQISRERSLYRLTDKIKLDAPTQSPATPGCKAVAGLEKNIEHHVAMYADSLPPKLVDNLIRYGLDGTNSAALFEASVEKFFSLMGYDAKRLGQGYGRVADVIAKYRGAVYAKSYGLIIDAKAYEKYTFPASDIRKMKEYIDRHGQELMQDNIPNHAYAFISMAFSEPKQHLEEIAQHTAVNGTAIDIYTLLSLGSKVAKNELTIGDLYPTFTTNRLFVCP